MRFPRTTGANRASLIDAQRNYLAFGASEEQFLERVRPARSDEPLDPGWRPINLLVDPIEEAMPGVNYGTSYPHDLTALYYWRPTYWRRKE